MDRSYPIVGIALHVDKWPHGTAGQSVFILKYYVPTMQHRRMMGVRERECVKLFPIRCIFVIVIAVVGAF